MSVENFPSALVKIDRFLDFIPGLSTVTNTVNLIAKAILSCSCLRGCNNEWARHLRKKSVMSCIGLALPGMNVIVAICRCCLSYSETSSSRKDSRFLGRMDQMETKDLVDETTVVLDDVQENGMKAIENANQSLQKAYENLATSLEKIIELSNQDIANQRCMILNYIKNVINYYCTSYKRYESSRRAQVLICNGFHVQDPESRIIECKPNPVALKSVYDFLVKHGCSDRPADPSEGEDQAQAMHEYLLKRGARAKGRLR